MLSLVTLGSDGSLLSAVGRFASQGNRSPYMQSQLEQIHTPPRGTCLLRLRYLASSPRVRQHVEYLTPTIYDNRTILTEFHKKAKFVRGRASLFEQERGSVPHTKFFLMEDMEGPKPVTYIRGTTEESQCDRKIVLRDVECSPCDEI